MGDLFDLQALRTHVGLVNGVTAWRAWRPQADDPLTLSLPRAGGRGSTPHEVHRMRAKCTKRVNVLVIKSLNPDSGLKRPFPRPDG